LKAFIQRCSESSVKAEDEIVGEIGRGICLLLGIGKDDDESDLEWLVQKIIKLRIFDNEEGLIDLSLQDISGEILVISQFTLQARLKKGTRPSFTDAAPPAEAEATYEKCIFRLQELLGKDKISSGKFGAHMAVSLVNDGPFSLWIDTKNRV
jgi:D-tyrosyl-tRNA(Tyr) deacylase